MYQLFFVSSFSIAKNAEWTWTEFYWRTFHSETRVSSEDSRLLLHQMKPVYCGQTQCTCMLPARVALPLRLSSSDYLWMNLMDIEDTKTLLVMQWKCFCVKKSFFWILTLIYLDILGYLANTCNLLLIATFCYATILLNEMASSLEWPQGLISREMVIVSNRLVYWSFVCGVTLCGNSLLFSIVNLFSMFSLKSKEHQIKQLELELDQERRMAESLVEDMVIK